MDLLKKDLIFLVLCFFLRGGTELLLQLTRKVQQATKLDSLKSFWDEVPSA